MTRVRKGVCDMNEFKDIVGQDEIVNHLQTSIETEKVSHAYLFVGDNGAGKKTAAKAFAKSLLCEEGKGRACGKCKSCIQVDSGNNPDLKIVKGEKAITSKEEIRTQLVEDAPVKPYAAKYKVYIVPDTHLLRIESQNVLLKTIEEPPEYVVVILVADNMDSVIPTILSRCVKLKFKAIGDDIICKFLMENYQIPDYAARMSAAFSGGSIGRAIRYATTEDFAKMKEKTIRIMRGIDNMDLFEIMDMVKELSTDKDAVEDYLDLMLLWFRDVLMLKVTNDPNKLLYHDEYTAIKKQAQTRGYDGIEVILNAIEKTRTRLKANVNLETALELLILTMKNPIV